MTTTKFFSMNNTKAELLAEVKRLHNDILAEELKEPTGLQMISDGSVKVFNTVKYELPLLVKDVKNAGSNLRKLLTF